MERYGQYRDKGSGIAPFFPVPPPTSSPLLLPWRAFLFCIRLPLVTFAWVVWLMVIQWTPPGNILRKANLWCVLGIPGVWWIDLQVDGVRRGSLANTPRGRLPGAGQIIASSYTSPLDVLYLAAIFDPVFTQSHAGTRLVRPVSIEAALATCFDVQPPPPFNRQEGAIELSVLAKQQPSRVIVVFPESTTSNGRGILKLSHSLLSAAASTRIFPISLRYTPADIVTPLPGWMAALRFIWRLNSSPSHCIRVRIGAPLSMASTSASRPQQDVVTPDSPPPDNIRQRQAGASGNGFESNYFDTLQASSANNGTTESFASEEDEGLTGLERKTLDAVADTLARLGRVKRVGLGVEEKVGFLEAWNQSSKRK